MAMAIVAFGAARRSVVTSALGLVVLTGIAVAQAEARALERCRGAAATAPTWIVELEDAAAPGGYVRGRAIAGSCVVPATLSVERGSAAAAARVAVTGEAIAGERGLLIRSAQVGTTAAPGSLLARWRAAARARVDRIFRTDAPLARALLVADTRGIPVDMRDRYAAAGVVHLLSISGLHVAIIAAAVELLLQLVRLPRRAASMTALAITALYIAVIGAPAPAVRSGVMLGATVISKLAQRPTSPWSVLALGALLPLVEPRTILDLGYQLSVAGMAGIIASGALARRVIVPALDGWRRSLASDLLASVIASLVTTPLVAWTFGRVSLIAPLTNLIATPLLGLAQPMLFLALVLGPLHPLARFVADAVHPLLALFDAVSVAGAAVPYASIAVAPTLRGAVLAAIFSIAIVLACVSRFPTRAVITAVATLALLAWLPVLPQGSAGVELHMIDVGQGDALALRTPGGRWVLFDAGRIWKGGDAGRSAVVPYVQRRGGTVEAFVLSHPHDDHVGGAPTILEALRPRQYLDPAYATGSDAYRTSLAIAARRRIPWRRVTPGDSLEIDGVVLRVLAPDSAWTTTLTDANDASAVVLIQYGSVRFLMTGDAEADEEAWLVRRGTGALRADVLKVAHHGSRTSTSREFLRAVRPSVALISVGGGNRYGHPGARVLADLASAGAIVLRTDRSGSVVVRTDGTTLSLEVEGETWPLSPRSGRP
jgi:competence protein ComEC